MQNLSLTTIAATLLGATQLASSQPVLPEDFADGVLDPQTWCVTELNPNVISIDERNGRLEVSSPGNNGIESEAFIYNCGWALDATTDFRWRASFFANPAGITVNGDVGLGVVCWFAGEPAIGITSQTTAVLGQLGLDTSGSYFGSELWLNGNLTVTDYESPAPITSGTVFYAYDASADTLSISAVGYDGFDRAFYSGLRAASGSDTANIAFSGYSQGFVSAFAGSQLWFDNIVVDQGTIVIASACPADLNGDGIADQGDIQTFITFFLVQDLAVDFNGDGIVDLGDIQAFIATFLEGC